LWLSTAFPQNIQEAELPAAIDANAEEHIDHKQWIGYIADLQAAYLLYITGMVYSWGL
jgi:hypothetical protein